MGSEERRRRHVGRFISATVLGAALAASVTLTGSAAVPASARHMSSNSPPAYQDGVVLVGFDKSTSQQQQVAEVAGAGATDTRTIGVGVHILHVPPGQVLSAAHRLATQPGIRYAEPDYIEYESGVPNDPSFGLQWGYQNTGQTVNNISGTPGADEHAVQAWNITTGSRSIVIGEADTGVDYTHPDLAANIWSNPGGVGGCAAGTHGYNVISSTCDPMDDDTVYGGHGTHVAGILGAVGNNRTGVTGVNWTTTILPVKWVSSSGAATTSNLIIGLDWLLKAKQAGVNVRVVNDSNTLAAPSQALSDEIDLLGGNGILFVTAASNFGANNDNPALRRYPCGFERPTEICVTATNQQDQLPTWANYGPTTVDLAAPGNNVYSTLRNATYGYINGTSMASPQVAGAAALILSVQEMSPQALKADILENVDPLPSLSGLVRTGGRLDICRAVPGCTQSSPPALFNVTPPSISGFTQLGQTLTATTGDWTGGPTSYTYQWRRCSSSGSSCADVAGATSASYQPVSADVGSTMQVAVTAKVGTNTVTGYSPPSSAVQSTAPAFPNPPWVIPDGHGGLYINGTGDTNWNVALSTSATAGAKSYVNLPSTVTDYTPPSATPCIAVLAVFNGTQGNGWSPWVCASWVPTYSVGAVGTDNGLWVLHSGSASFTGDGGVLLGAPAIVAVQQTSGPASPIYIATGSDHGLWVRNDSHGWQSFGGAPIYCIDNPGAAVIAGTLYVACQGQDHALWHAETPAPSGTNLPTLNVSSWQSLGGALSAGPAVASVAGKPTYFVIGTDQHVYSIDLSSSGFTGYQWSCVGHPALATFGSTSYFACHGTDGSLWYATNSGSGWSSAQSLGGALVDGVGVAATATGPVFFIEGTDGGVWQRTITSGWTSDGGQVKLGLAASAL
jgi:thermitase